MKKRDSVIDNLKSILIILVVIGHFGSSGSLLYNAFILFIFSFHMPLFMFVSGYLSKNVEKCREKAVEEYLLLFVIAQVLWILYKILIGRDFYYLSNLLEPGFGLWYILSIFVYRLLLKDLVRIRFLVIPAAVLSVAIMAVTNIEHFFDLRRMVGFFIYFLIGYYTSQDTLDQIRRIPSWVAAVGLAAAAGVICIMLDQNMTTYGFMLKFFQHQATVYEFSSVAVGVFAYIMAIPASIAIGAMVLALIPRGKMWYTYIGQDTLPVYLSHTYGVVIYREFIRDVVTSNSAKVAAIMICSWLCILFFSSGSYRRIFGILKKKVMLPAILRHI